MLSEDVRKVLRRARNLFAKSPVHDPTNTGEDAQGKYVPFAGPGSCRFCVFGALERVRGRSSRATMAEASAVVREIGWDFTGGRINASEAVRRWDKALAS